jgi:hypothetical protein
MRRRLANGIFIPSSLVPFISCFLIAGATPARGETTYDWPTLQKIRRIAVVPPFFYARPESGKPDEEHAEFRSQMRALSATVAVAAQRDLAEGDRFQLVSPDAVRQALRALRWRANDLFTGLPSWETHGRPSAAKTFMKNVAPGKEPWPQPNAARIARLARKLDVDGVVVGTMREPISVGAGILIRHDENIPNPINLSVRRMRDHVDSPRIHAALIARSGSLAWSDDLMAGHPRTKRRTMKTLALDWQEATQEVVQLMADSLFRLPPPEKKK